jgi:high affinity sulfate transporter 1
MVALFKKNLPAKSSQPDTTNKKRLLNKKSLNKYVPITDWLPLYKRNFIIPDLIAAITIIFITIPQAIAYADMAGVPPEVGFYTIPLPLVAYAIFGSSRHIVIGPSSTIAVLSFAIISAIVVGEPERFLFLTAALAIISGILFVIFGIAKLGFISNFISKPVVTGFIFGIALVIIMRQIPKLFGITSVSDDFFQIGLQTIKNLTQTHGWTILVGATSLLILFILEIFVPRAPAAIIALIYGILIVTFLGLSSKGVAITGEISSALPKFDIPDIRFTDIIYLIPGAFAIVFVGFAESLGAARNFALKHDYSIDPDQEMIALGVSNLGAGFSSGFSVDASLARSAAAERAGAKTQMASIIAAGFALVVALWLTPFFKNLPEATLAAIIIHAVWRMMRVKEMKRIFTLRKIDFWLAMLALFGVLIFDVLPGLIIAVFASLIAITIKASRPYLAILGKEPDRETYSDIKRNPENIQIEGLTIIRPSTQLYFANIKRLQDKIKEITELKPGKIKTIILSLELTSELDTDSIDALFEIKKQLDKDKIKLMLARVHGNVRDALRSSGLYKEIGQKNIFKNVNRAVEEHKRRFLEDH